MLFERIRALRLRTLLSSLRTISAILVLIGVAIAMGLALYSNLELRRLAAVQAQEEALRLARVAAASQGESIEETRRVLTILAQLAEVKNDDQRTCSALLAKILEQNPRYTNLGVINRDGNIFCSAQPRSEPIYAGDRGYFQRALATQDFAAGEFQIGRITGRPGINFGYPVFDESGEMQAVVFAALDLGWLNDLAASLDLAPGAVLFTVDRQGTILTRYPEDEQWIGQALPEAPIIRAVLGTQGERTAEMEGLDGVSRFYAFTPLGDDTQIGAHVVMGVSTIAANAAADRDLVRSLIALGILALLFVAVSWAVTDLFVLRHVRALARAATSLTGGDLGARTELPTGRGELGQLAATFDEMAASLEQRMRRLRALNSIDRAITGRHELAHTLDVVLEQVMSQLNIDAATILLLDEMGEYLENVASRGLYSDELKGARLKLGEGYAGRVAVKRESLFIRNLGDAGAFAHAPMKDEEFVSYGGVPLITEGKIQGVLSVFGREPLHFEEEWVAFLEALALQAAIAIDNWRLLDKTREQARQLQQIGDTLPEGVFLLDTGKHVILANRLANRYLCKLAGATVDETVTKLGDRPLEAFLESEGNGQSWQEVTLPGEDRIFEVASQRVEDNGRLEGWVFVLREVTEERKRQEYMQTHERLATLGQAASGIAHDFNNIMAVISMHSEVLERNPEHPRREKYLMTIGGQAREASQLVSQILDFSRESRLERERLDLSTFVSEEASLLKRILPKKLSVTLHSASGEFTVEADPTRLRQVLMNLAINARDAMPDGGQLQLALSRFSLSSKEDAPVPDMEPGDYVCLFVSDNGPGIPRDVLPRIFEPFFTTKERGRGTGLGLAQVYGLIKQHDGVIHVESTPGSGTTFMIYLPALVESDSTRLADVAPHH